MYTLIILIVIASVYRISLLLIKMIKRKLKSGEKPDFNFFGRVGVSLLGGGFFGGLVGGVLLAMFSAIVTNTTNIVEVSFSHERRIT